MTDQIITVPSEAASQLEQLGTKSKFWYREATTNESMLFKEGRVGTGENWFEKICCEICRLLGVPHANYDFAVCGDRQGVVTNNFVPKGGRLIHGNELLVKLTDNYNETMQYRARQHTVRLVMVVTGAEFVKYPLGWDVPVVFQCPNDVFVGYLMIDALVSNQDRHHENWGMIYIGDGLHLALSYDHASSLGRNENDQNMIERLTTLDYGRSVDSYIRRAKSAFYDTHGGDRPLGTLAAFQESVNISPIAGAYWLDKLEQVSQADFEELFRQIPNGIISETAIEFALKMLELNTQRLLSTR